MIEQENTPRDEHWQEELARLSQIRANEDYSADNVALILDALQAEDERLRAGGALAAEGCLLEPHVLDRVIELAEYDPAYAVRKAAIQVLGEMIREGVEEGLEDETGPDNLLDYAEEWEEYQAGGLRDDYQRVKALLFDILEQDMDPEIQRTTLTALSDLGYLPHLRLKISEMFEAGDPLSRLAAVNAMGKYPHFWESELLELLNLDTPIELLKAAISACYSSSSPQLADAIEKILEHDDPEVLRYALLTLANINQSRNLAEILQEFSLHGDTSVREAARAGIDTFARKNFEDFLREDLGMDWE